MNLQRLISATIAVPFAMATLAGCNHSGAGSSAPATPADTTQLATAIRSGDTETADHLLTAKPDLANAKDENGKTPMAIAGEKSDSNMVSIIKDHGGHE